jgi:hypothetical protein
MLAIHLIKTSFFLLERGDQTIGKKTIKHLLPMQLGYVPDTYADVSDLIADFGTNRTHRYKSVSTLLWRGTRKHLKDVKKHSI